MEPPGPVYKTEGGRGQGELKNEKPSLLWALKPEEGKTHHGVAQA